MPHCWKSNALAHMIVRVGIIRALNESAGKLLRAAINTDKTTLIIKVRKGASRKNGTGSLYSLAAQGPKGHSYAISSVKKGTQRKRY